jgi:hypothetical protein
MATCQNNFHKIDHHMSTNEISSIGYLTLKSEI